jgi:hypothetical protein
MWISKRFGIYLKTWKCSYGGPFVGKVWWRGLREFHPEPAWSLVFWVGRRVFALTRNAA